MSNEATGPAQNTPTTVKPEPSTFEKQMARREYRLKLLAALISITTLNLSLITFFIQRHKEAEQFEMQRQKDFANSFYQQRTRIYLETVRVLSQAAVATDEKSFKDAANRFFVQYWGEMCAVEDKDVEAKMVRIGQVMSEAMEAGNDWRKVQEQVQLESLQLANVFRQYINGTYGTDLKAVKRDAQ